ncbi:MAG: sigma factor, partial [Planctomycetota bacterium]
MDRHTNLTLLQRIRDPKDGIAWGEFNYIYGGLLNQWLRRQGVNGEDCNDIAQEVLLAVSQLIQDFQHNGNVGAFRKWLRSVMVYRMRRFIETRRKRKSKVS